MKSSLKKKLIMSLSATCVFASSISGITYASSAQAIEQNLAQESQSSQKSIFIKSIAVDSNLRFNGCDNEINKVIAPYLEKELSLIQLNELKDKITNLYREHGFLAATAYLPQQSVENGELKINVLDGKLGKIYLTNNSKLDDKVLTQKASDFKQNEVVNTFKVEKFLYDLNSVNGVIARGELRPGSNVGETNLYVQVDDTNMHNGIIYADNYGNDYSGKYRMGILDNFYNLDGRGSEVSVGGLISNKDLHDFFVDASTPVQPYNSKTKVGIGVDRTSYELGNEYAALDVSGSSTTYKAYGKTIAYNTMNHNLEFNYGYDYKDINDDISAFGLDSKKHSHAIHIGLEGGNRWKDNVANYSATITSGTHINDSEYASILNEFNHTEGRFTKFNAESNYFNLIAPRWTFKNHTKLQVANKNLDSSEKMSVGGINGVRAYANGELSADEGFLMQNAISYRTGDKNFSIDFFVDAAQSRTVKSNDDWSSLYGYGIELNYTKPNDYFAKLDYARRIGFDDNMSKDAQSHDRIWFMAGKMF